MSWFPDMGTVTMIDAGDHVRAIGWLSSSHPFAQGDVPAKVRARLRAFVAQSSISGKALGWGAYMGVHRCELCDQFSSHGEFGVPDGALLFVAPVMIEHYVKLHRYRPPDEFMTALMRSSQPGTDNYRRAIEPFRQLHEQYQERRYQQRIERAGLWAFEQGGSDQKINEAAFEFFHDKSPKLRERIRQAMPHATPATKPITQHLTTWLRKLLAR